MLRDLSGRGFVNIEIKVPGHEKTVLELARTTLKKETFLFSSFLPDVVATYRALAPDVPAIWIVAERMTLEDELNTIHRVHGNGIAFYHELITPELAGFFKIHNVPLFTWTVNDLAEFRRVVELGVSGVITDEPRLLAEAK
ncbi:MAG: glycerophosphodiester phosphodiesterase [bacterium]|nr:glycerophosphodiester phosphodiesterase [bacterium]